MSLAAKDLNFRLKLRVSLRKSKLAANGLLGTRWNENLNVALCNNIEASWRDIGSRSSASQNESKGKTD
jgi:hypothetical protein